MSATTRRVVTSPPYSDADAVEFLRPLKARLHLRGQVGAAGRRPSPRRPRLDVRLRHEHAATLADDRDVPQVRRLVGHVRRAPDAGYALESEVTLAPDLPPYAVRDGKHLYQYAPREEGGQGPA